MEMKRLESREQDGDERKRRTDGTGLNAISLRKNGVQREPKVQAENGKHHGVHADKANATKLATLKNSTQIGRAHV